MLGTRNGRARLDDMRIRHGALRMREYFHTLALAREDEALALINDSALQYPTLYLLEPEIVQHELGGKLSDRNRRARLLAGDFATGLQTMAGTDRPDLLPALQWMHRTGWRADHLGEQYDEIMDAVAVTLAHQYHDSSCCRTVGELLFDRHRRGQYTYDLQWAFFAGPSPRCLRVVERKLRSHDGRDVELARKYLNFMPEFQSPGRVPDREVRQARRWLVHNRHRLEPTGATSQEGAGIHRWRIGNGRI